MDIALDWPADGTTAGDFGVSPDGDLLVADGDTEARQRATRRLLTNPRIVKTDGTVIPCDYIFDPTYGVGLRRYIGAAASSRTAENIKQIARDGLLQDDVISSNPVPTVLVQSTPNGLSVAVQFTSAVTGKPVSTPKINLS